MLHSTSFELEGKLCFIACAKPEKNYENWNLPFLCLPLNFDKEEGEQLMNYQREKEAGLINEVAIQQTEQKLKNILASLKNVNIINPYASQIQIPTAIQNPSKTLHLLFSFINVISFFHQYQRTNQVNQETGEIQLTTSPDDIALAFRLLKNSLFHRADELSNSIRLFYNWLEQFLEEAGAKEFTALDIRKVNTIKPRTLNHYLNELKNYHYIQVVGGNKHREGYRYKITSINDLPTQKEEIEKQLNLILKKISRQVGKKPLADSQNHATTQKTSKQQQNIKTATV